MSSKGAFREVGYPTDDARWQVLEAVNAIVDGIGDGLFPMRPAEPVWRPWVACHYCEPDALGTRDQWRDFLRKLGDRSLVPYLDLVDADRDDSPDRQLAEGVPR